MKTTLSRFIAVLLSLALLACLPGSVLAEYGDSQSPDSFGQGGGWPSWPGAFPGSGPFGQYPGFGQNGQDGQDSQDGQYPGNSPFGQFPGFGQDGQQQTAPEETTLMAMPSARSVRSGEELTLAFDLRLSEKDTDRISVIQQGTTLEYTLTYTPLAAAPSEEDPADAQQDAGGETPVSEDEARSVTTAAQTVTFSMDRENNERCTLTLRPEAEESSVLTVSARMVFTDGETLDCDSGKILVYTEPEVRSHLSAVACAAGDQLRADLVLIGPEGQWQFTCRLSRSADGGQTYQPSEEVLTSFSVNTRQREPNASFDFTVTADGNCFCRIEAEVTLPDGTVLSHVSDPFMVSAETVSPAFSSSRR